MKKSLVKSLGLSLAVIALVVAISWMYQGSRIFGLSAKLGVVDVIGPITGSADVVSALVALEQDAEVKAVVVRIDSPGGAVGSSQEIYRAISLMSKPVVASMGNTAASGGYYIAAACDKIVANPGTITGSIGVITTLPNLESLLDKLGIKFQTMASGPLKGAGQSDRPLNAVEKTMFEQLLSNLHSQFVDDVAKGRGLEVEQVAVLADGRVYTGSQALENGLVDLLGNYQDAVHLAATMAGLAQVPDIIVRPQDQEDFWQMLGIRRAMQAMWQDTLAFIYANALPRFIMAPPGARDTAP